MYLSNKTSEALDEIVGGFFSLNRSFDRAVSVMQNKWAMPQAADIVHNNLAHLFPLLGDVVSSFKDNWNVDTIYPETHRDARDYKDLSDMMSTLERECGEVYQMIKLTYQVAKDEGDINACAMLFGLVEKMTKVMGQVLTLKDKAEQMPIEYDKYDAHIDDWGIVGLEL